MGKIPVIAIFDIGKTNKKLFLFDQQYQIVLERTTQFSEIKDEDGEPCENLEYLKSFVLDTLQEVLHHPEFEIRAVNFSTYGASFVYISEEGKSLTPLYNYLKKYPEHLKKTFYDAYGGEKKFSAETASPVLGSLNSAMQLYRIKKENPELFNHIKYALHLPQYLSFLLSGRPYSDITSVGCHTNLWDFKKNQYHHWVSSEGIENKLAPFFPSDKVVEPASQVDYKVGIGLHDSSAALIPYLVNFHEPFVLISTGTWCISLNPFNHTPLTEEDLEKDCLCYLTYKGKPVKASRIFAGYEHEQQVKRIAQFFNESVNRYQNIEFDSRIISQLEKKTWGSLLSIDQNNWKETGFSKRNLNEFSSDIEAYHQLILDIVKQQYLSTSLILRGADVKRIFVDGGFSRNSIYMNLLTFCFPEIEIYASSMPQATALGTAMAIHQEWNSKPLPSDIVKLKFYSFSHQI